MYSQKPRKFLALSLAAALLLSMVVLQGSFASEYLVTEQTTLSPFTGSISLDVNPSIELKIENGTVVSALAYNDDGQNLLLDNNLSGLTAEEAVKSMTRALVEGGYLTPSDAAPYLFITVSGSGVQAEDAAEALHKAAREAAVELGTEFEVMSSFVPEDVATQAAALGLSAGRYLLMQNIAESQSITLEEAVAKYGTATVGELMDLFVNAEDLPSGDNKDEVQGEVQNDNQDEDLNDNQDEDQTDSQDEDLNDNQNEDLNGNQDEDLNDNQDEDLNDNQDEDLNDNQDEDLNDNQDEDLNDNQDEGQDEEQVQSLNHNQQDDRDEDQDEEQVQSLNDNQQSGNHSEDQGEGRNHQGAGHQNNQYNRNSGEDSQGD